MRRSHRWLVLLASWLPTAALAAEVPPSATVAEPAGDDPGLGLALGVTLASAYGWRGQNVYQDDSQHDQNAQLAPHASYTFADTPITLTYFSSYQLTGDDINGYVDVAIGAEQDFTAEYAFTLSDTATLSCGSSVYLSPFAEKDAAGATCPTYLEPFARIDVASLVDLSADVEWYRGMQSAIVPLSYVYTHASVGKSVAASDTVSIDGLLGFGHKFYATDAIPDQEHDIHADLSVAITFGSVTVTPGVHWMWTNLDATSFEHEQFVFAGLDVSVSF